MAASSAADGTQPGFQTDIDLLPLEGTLFGDYLDLRQHIDFSLTHGDLRDHWDFPHYKRINANIELDHLDQGGLANWWEKVTPPYLHRTEFEKTLEWEDARLQAYEHHHNGIYELRRNLQTVKELFVDPRSQDGIDIEDDKTPHFLSKEETHHLAYRIISQIQQQERAVYGKFSQRKWWVAPPTEAIELPLVQTPNAALPGSLSSAELAKARGVSYTVHWVCYTDTNHIAVIIREAQTGHSWYFDSASAHSQNDENHQLVLSGLHRWCLQYNINVPDGNRHRQVEVVSHDLAWTCGLHAIANTLAFLRFGILGWHEVSGWAEPLSDESKLRKMRHDLMIALELSMGYRPTIWLPGHYDGGDNLSMFRFPSYRSVNWTREDLHNSATDPFEDMISEDALEEIDGNLITMLQNNYRRAHIECHDGISIQDNQNGFDLFSYRVYAELHNGLHNMRNGQYLGAKEVHYHGTRLITQVQQSENARLGPAKAENQEWWIAPDEYIIKCQLNKDTYKEEDQQVCIMALSEMTGYYKDRMMGGSVRDLSEDKEKYRRAKYTVHWVHHSEGHDIDHRAVIVREKATNFAWYFDSLKNDRERRFDHAVRVFNKWLARCGVTRDSESFLVPALAQVEGWECGLHAIAHAMAFLRFGVLGWDKLPNEAIALGEPPTGTGDNASGLSRLDIAERFCDTMTSALHGLMGVAWPQPQPPSQGNGDKANTGTTEKTGTDTGNANGKASETQSTNAIGSSNQPLSQGNGDKANTGTIEKTGTDSSKPSGGDSVPHPSFFDQDAYNQQVPGFRFPTYPSIPLEPELVRLVSERPYNARLKDEDKNLLKPAYLCVDKVCCDKVSLVDEACLNAVNAYKEIHDALVAVHKSDHLEDYGMYHLACRLFSIVMANGPDTPSRSGPSEKNRWWIAPRAFLIEIPTVGSARPIPTFTEFFAAGVEDLDGDFYTFEGAFDDALYTVHFVNTGGWSSTAHWTVIIRESDTGRLWHFDSVGASERIYNEAVDALKDWLRRCNKKIPTESFNVPTIAQDDGWTCSLHAMANAMAFLRFGILGWKELKCIALETDPEPADPASTVNAEQLRETMRRSLLGIFGLITGKFDKELDKNLKKTMTEERDFIKKKKAEHDQKTREPQGQEDPEQNSYTDDEELQKEFGALPSSPAVGSPQTPVRPVGPPDTPSTSNTEKANRSLDRLLDDSIIAADMKAAANARPNRAANQRAQQRQIQNLLKETLQNAARAKARQEEAAKKKAKEEEKKKRKAQEEEEAKKRAQEEEEKKRKAQEEQEKQQQQVASNPRKREGPDDDDDSENSEDPSGRPPKRPKRTPEGLKKNTPKETPTPKRRPEGISTQTPNNKRKTPTSDATEQPQPAKRARKNQIPGPKAPVRQSERQKKAQEAAAAAAAAAEAEDESSLPQLNSTISAEPKQSDQSGKTKKPEWRVRKLAYLNTLSRAQLVAECKRRRLAGPPIDRVRTIPYSGYNCDQIIERLIEYDDPWGMEVSLERPLEDLSVEELKVQCKEWWLRYGGQDEELLRQRMRYFFAEQQRFVQILIGEGQIPKNWEKLEEGAQEGAHEAAQEGAQEEESEEEEEAQDEDENEEE